MTAFWGRWLVVALLAIGLGLAGLECAVVRASHATVLGVAGLPHGAGAMLEVSSTGGMVETEPAAKPRLTS